MAPQASVVAAASAGIPIAYRFCTQSAARHFAEDPFLRALRPVTRSTGPLLAWRAGVRLTNRLPELRLRPERHRAAIAWVSEALRRKVGVPDDIEPALERVIWPATHRSDRFAKVKRELATVPTMAFVGRITIDKGIDVPISALRVMRDECAISARLLVAGPEDRRERRRLEAIARDVGVAEQIEWLGMLDFEGLAVLLARAHALVIPSRWYEPFPLVACEAAFGRVPVVASNIGGIPEALTPDDHALFFPPEDVKGCAAALTRVILEPGESAARAERAFRHAQAHFGVERYQAAIDHFLQDAVRTLSASRSGPT